MDSPAPSKSTPALPADSARPRRLRLSVNRQLIGDLLYFAASVPRFPVERLMPLAELAELRNRAATGSAGRISWAVLFLKAFAIVAEDCPALRQAYLAWPWPHLGQLPTSVGILTINRQEPTTGEDRLCWGRFIEPHREPLAALQKTLDTYQTGDIDSTFKRQKELGWMPLPLRRLIWWLNLNTLSAKRAKRIGTFSLSTLAGEGAWNRFHPSIHATSLTYGPLNERGESLVTLICDHRVLDGLLAARVLGKLEAAMCGPIAEELTALAASRAAA